MYPNQPQQPGQPTPSPQPVPQPADPYAAQQPMAYDPNYLDSIAPPPARGKFLSGTFGKLVFVLIAVFVLAVSLIIAFSGGDNTADLQQVAVRLDNYSLSVKAVQKNLKSNNLSATNTNYQIWMTNSLHDAETLLGQGGVKKTDYSKTMVASEKKIVTDLDAKFEDARLNATLDRIYASTMAAETQKLINMFTLMSKNSKSKPIRDYAKSTSANLVPIQKGFDKYVDNGN
jgi:hypothetical protein